MLSRSAVRLGANLKLATPRHLATAARSGSRNAPRAARPKPAASGGARGKVPTTSISSPEPSRAPRLEDGSPKYPLRPNVLSARLKELCANGKVEDAVAVLKNMPLEAQNAPVWNTMIWECMKSRKYALGYKLYVDMKRRGVAPTTRTYATMFSGLARIPKESWPSFSKQQDHAMSLWSNFSSHLTALKARREGLPTSDFEYISLATASYLAILANSGLYPKLFETFYSLDTTGPLAPDNVVFAALLRALAERKSSTPQPTSTTDIFKDPGSLLPTRTVRDKNESPFGKQKNATAYQNASDARLLWRRMMTIFDVNAEQGLGSRYQVDSHILSGILDILALGKSSDQKFGLDLVQQYLGLTTSAVDGEARSTLLLASPESSARASKSMPEVPPLLTTYTLQAALHLALEMGHPQVAISMFNQVLDIEHGANISPSDSLIDRGHVDYCLRAYRDIDSRTRATDAIELLRWAIQREHLGAGFNIRPQAPTYRAALLVCSKAEDWKSACVVWELMSGWRVAAFKDNSTDDKQRVLRGKNLNIDPGVEEMLALAITASAAARANIAHGSRRRDATILRQCLRMLVAASIPRVLRGERMYPQDKAKDVVRARLVQVVIDLVEDALPKVPKPVSTAEGDGGISPEQAEEEKQWRELARLAEAVTSHSAHEPDAAERHGQRTAGDLVFRNGAQVASQFRH